MIDRVTEIIKVPENTEINVGRVTREIGGGGAWNVVYRRRFVTFTPLTLEVSVLRGFKTFEEAVMVAEALCAVRNDEREKS